MQKAFKIALIIILSIIIAISLRYFEGGKTITLVTDWIKSTGFWAPIIFIACYIVATLCMLPGSALTLVGGFIFGPIWGTLYSISGAVIGAIIAFILARYIMGEWLRQKLKGRIDKLLNSAENQGWKFVAALRLMPILPFNILNYAFGFTRVKLLDYIWASFVFMLPGCFAYTYLGHLGEAAIVADKKDLIGKVFIAIGLLVFLAILPWLVKKWKQTKEI